MVTWHIMRILMTEHYKFHNNINYILKSYKVT